MIELQLPLARRTDHDSSHAAADRAERSGRLATDRARVLLLVHRNPGLTSLELAQRGGLDRYMVARRLSDCEKLGLVSSVREPGKQIRWIPR